MSIGRVLAISDVFNKDQLLFQLWEDYGIDSTSGGWDYIERVMLGYACGEVIETIHNLKVKPKGLKAVAQVPRCGERGGAASL